MDYAASHDGFPICSALFQKYHVGAAALRVPATDTLATVAMNHGLDSAKLSATFTGATTWRKTSEITPRETAELLKQGKIKLLDVRTPEEYATSVPGSVLADQNLAQEIMQTWPKDTAIAHDVPSRDAQSRCRGVSARAWF
jgi:hypothetical protein